MDDWKPPGKETACQKWTLIQSRRSSHQSNNCFTARAYAMRVLRLRMMAVKNSMKRRLARSPLARIITGSISSPARTSAGGGTISPVFAM